MDIQDESVSELKPYTANPRVISASAVDRVAESISSFGWQQPIVVDADNVIIAGHTRYLAAMQLGLDVVPVKRAEDLTEEQAKAYRLVDNKLSDITQWDNELLIEELEAIGSPEELSGLLEMFLDEKAVKSDAAFLNAMIQADSLHADQSAVSVGEYVTLSFVLSPEDRDMAVNALRMMQHDHNLENTTQALIKLLGDLV